MIQLSPRDRFQMTKIQEGYNEITVLLCKCGFRGHFLKFQVNFRGTRFAQTKFFILLEKQFEEQSLFFVLPGDQIVVFLGFWLFPWLFLLLFF